MNSLVPSDRLLEGRPRSGREVVRVPVSASSAPQDLVAAVDQAWRLGFEGVDLDGPELLTRRALRPLLRQARRRGLSLGLRSADLHALASVAVVRGAVEAMNLRRVVLQGDVARAPEIIETLADAGVSVVVELEGPSAELAELADSVDERATIVVTWRGRHDPSALAAWAAARRSSVAAGAGAARAAGAIVLHGLPRCLHPPGVARGGETPALVGGQVVRLEARQRVKPPGCAGCGEHGLCDGVPVTWYREHGDAALTPIAQTRADVPASDLRGVPAAPLAPDRRPVESARLDVAPRYPDVALVTLMVAGCDLACIFCETPQADPASVAFSTPDSVSASLHAQVGRASGVFFTGGEPTQLPWLLDALARARSLGYQRIQMQTHAGRASDDAYARALVDAGLTAVDVPLYGPDAATHDRITNTPGSFVRTRAGLRVLRELGVRAVLHTTIFASNLPRLDETLRALDALRPDAIYLQVAGAVGAPGTWRAVSPDPRDVGAALAAALVDRPLVTPLTLSDLAPCQVPGLEAHVPSWRGAPVRDADAVVLPYGEWLMVFTAGGTRAHAPSCETCTFRAGCDGVPLEILDRWGADVVRPRPRPPAPTVVAG